MNCDKCGADFEAILDWKEGAAERERELATLRAELERTKLARNATEARLAEAEPRVVQECNAKDAVAAVVDLSTQLAIAEARKKALFEAAGQAWVRRDDDSMVALGRVLFGALAAGKETP